MTDEDEFIEVSDDYSALAQLDTQDREVKESVVAYLMWHSGEILNKVVHPDRQARANRIDALGERAIDAFRTPDDIRVDSRRTLATKSIFTQSSISREKNPNSIVCYLDAEMIMSGAMIPLVNLDDAFSLVTPPELGEVGFNFSSFEDFRTKYIQLGTYLVTDPMTVITMFEHLQDLFLEKSIVNYNTLSTFHTIVPHWNVVGAPEQCERTFDSLSSYDTGKVVKIQGQVSEVGDTMVVYTKIAFRCNTNLVDEDGNKLDRKCNKINLQPQNPEEGVVSKPQQCSACGGKELNKLDSDKSRIEPIQRIQMQEVNISEEPKAIMVELRGNLTDLITAGSTIEITGIVRLSPLTKGGIMNSMYILGQSLRIVSEEAFTLVISDEDEEAIKDFVDTWTLEERMEELCSAWIGHIKLEDEDDDGNPTKEDQRAIKYALMLQAIGSSQTPFGHRTAIHIMIAGDPGTAKTLLLLAMQKILPASRYLDASGATAVGLTAAAEQIEDFYTGKKRWGLKPGIIPLTPKDAICSIDEFNLYKGDFGDINTALESGKIYKTTGPVKGILDAPASILAGSNPMAGEKKKFVTGEGMSFTNQIGMDLPQLQRFDLIYVLLDEADYDRDRDIAMSILGSGANTMSSVDLPFVQRYIALSKRVEPEFTEQAREYIAERHAKKREAEKGDYMRSHRLVPALQRLSLATARFDFSDKVTLEHVKYAEKICAASINEEDPGLLTGAVDKESRQKRDATIRLVKELMDKQDSTTLLRGVEHKVIKDYLKEEGIEYNKNDLRITLESLSFLTVSNNKYLYDKED
jgi:DNA replicative helicase MCM subunit Mcm2 (Cdc46/Mcm family)